MLRRQVEADAAARFAGVETWRSAVHDTLAKEAAKAFVEKFSPDLNLLDIVDQVMSDSA